MAFYPPKINERFLHLQNTGETESATAIATNGSFVCGAVLRISLRVENDIIISARFKAAGCGFLIAAADVLCERIAGKNIVEGINIFQIVENELGEFEPSRKHCLELVWQTFQKAVNNFRATKREDWNGDEALICTCFGVSEKTIEIAIAKNLLVTVEDVSRVCNAGAGCGSCQPLIEDILANVWRGEI